jgi:hypothetical protein
MGKRPGDPEEGVIKKLFALGGNRCAFQNVDSGTCCENELARPEWPRTRARVCHIAGESPEGPRFQAAMSVPERKAYENFIVMCPTHADHIDYIEPEKYTIDVLTEMQRLHVERCGDKKWASDAELDRYSGLVLVYQFGVDPSELSSGFVENVGGAATLGTTMFGAGTLAGGGTFEGTGVVGPQHTTAGKRVDGATAVETDTANAGSVLHDEMAPQDQVVELEGVPSGVEVGKPSILVTDDGSPIVTDDGSPLEVV